MPALEDRVRELERQRRELEAEAEACRRAAEAASRTASGELFNRAFDERRELPQVSLRRVL